MAHQQTGKRSKFFNRLFPWRSSSRRSSSGSKIMTSIRDPSTRLFVSVATATAATTTGSSVGSSVRRTSPVDLNLGTSSDHVPPIDSSSFATHEIPITRRLFHDLNDKSHFSVQPDLLAEQIDKEELGALRHLASELHAALRLSEEENVLLKAKLQALDDWGLTSDPFLFSPLRESEYNTSKSGASKLDQLIDELRDIASSQPTSPFSSPVLHRRNIRDLGRILQQRQLQLRRLTNELQETQTELLFTKVELEQVRRCLHRLDQRLMCAEEELDMARQELLQASFSKQRLMQELQTTRGLLMRCWSRVRLLEQQHSHRPKAS